jgi:NAD(P)-dependent dehydrogenase (short-subunit alcohol dehydrogenase family)
MKGQVAVISGGRTGVGRAIALALGCAGAKVAVVARREAPLSNPMQIRGRK